MGLAVVHGIVETCGGKIVADSTPGQGTSFTVYLPITKKRHEISRPREENIPRGTEHVLFIDDEAPIVKMGHKILSGLGYAVTTRTSSLEALELFRHKPDTFDLVITDMTMPNMTGDELAVKIMEIRSDIPVILCTGYSKKISKETASKIGINAFFHKPIIRSELAGLVRNLLDGDNP